MQFCLDQEPKSPENGQLLDILMSSVCIHPLWQLHHEYELNQSQYTIYTRERELELLVSIAIFHEFLIISVSN